MSIVIRVKGANFSNSGLPKLIPTIAGFTTENLKGLFLFEEGTVDQAHSGQFVDSSGLGNHGTLRGNWLQPTKKAFGMQGGAGGIAINTGIAAGQKLTVVLGVKFNEPDPASNVYPLIFGPSAQMPASIAAAATLGSNKMFINAQFIPSSNANDMDWGVYKSGGPITGDATTRKTISGSAGHANSSCLIGFTYDATATFLLAKHAGGEFRTSAAALAFDPADTLAFGLLNAASGHNVAAGVELYLAAIYSDSSEALLDAAMAAARARITGRGVILL